MPFSPASSKARVASLESEGFEALALHTAVKYRASETVVRKLLEVNPDALSYDPDIAGHDSMGYAHPIVLAAMYGAPEEVGKLLLENTTMSTLSTFELAEAGHLGKSELLGRLALIMGLWGAASLFLSAVACGAPPRPFECKRRWYAKL